MKTQVIKSQVSRVFCLKAPRKDLFTDDDSDGDDDEDDL